MNILAHLCFHFHLHFYCVFIVCFVLFLHTVLIVHEHAYWLGLSRGAFTCVGWQVTLCDPM